MGDLSFAKSFNMLKSGELHHAVKLLKKGLPIQSKFMGSTWAFLLAKSLPRVSRDFDELVKWCDREIRQRMKVKSSEAIYQLMLISLIS